MPQEAAHLKVSRDGEIMLVEFTAHRILDEANIAQIDDELTALIEAEYRPKLVISFAGVDHLSSAALGTLISTNNKIRHHDGQMRLCGINPQIYEAFQITKLNNLFRIYPTVKEAKESMAPPAQAGAE